MTCSCQMILSDTVARIEIVSPVSGGHFSQEHSQVTQLIFRQGQAHFILQKSASSSFSFLDKYSFTLRTPFT